MAKLHKFTGYLVDINDDMESTEEIEAYINALTMNFSGFLTVFDGVTVENIEWDDQIDINKIDCSKETMDNYFEKQ